MAAGERGAEVKGAVETVEGAREAAVREAAVSPGKFFYTKGSLVVVVEWCRVDRVGPRGELARLRAFGRFCETIAAA